MRIPNYLRLAPSRVWHFRQVVPADLQAFFGQGTLMRSLRTTDLLTAQCRALELVQRYAEAFATARGQGVGKDSMPTVDEIIRSAKKKKTEPYKMIRSPDGALHLEANGDEDHRLMMDAWDRTQVEGIGPFSNESFVQQLPKEKTVTPKRAQVLGRPAGLPVTPPKVGTSSPRSRTKIVPAPSSTLRGGAPEPSSTLRGGGVPPLAIGKAAVKWLANIKPDTLRKTFIIKSAAINGFVDFYGDKKPLNDVTRVKVGEWVDAMKAKGLTTPTLVNKTSYLKGFFEWAKARGLYVSDDNPAQGQVVYRTREKRARRAMGFKAFPASQIRILFHQDGFRHLSAAARWGAVVGLYTGMRVAEVGQLALDDFVEVDGVSCIRITNEGAGQSVKTDSSLRTIPIHPHLIELGLLRRVAALRSQGQKRLFPKIKLDVVNGAGNWLSTAFSRHITMSLAKPDKGKFGFHSLRKTLVQELQTLGVQSEIRAAYVGHELDDEHHATYSRAPTSKELFEAVRKLDWKLDLKALTEWLH